MFTYPFFFRPRNIRQITSLRNTNKRLLFFLFLFVCIPDVSTCSYIMLLQKPDVIGILLILIYLLCQKNLTGKSIQDLK
jgi:hypothetical protein